MSGERLVTTIRVELYADPTTSKEHEQAEEYVGRLSLTDRLEYEVQELIDRYPPPGDFTVWARIKEE